MASVMPSDHEYLRQDYPHASLTIPQLRNILFTHGIEYPSSAKKALLLQVRASKALEMIFTSLIQLGHPDFQAGCAA